MSLPLPPLHTHVAVVRHVADMEVARWAKTAKPKPGDQVNYFGFVYIVDDKGVPVFSHTKAPNPND